MAAVFRNLQRNFSEAIQWLFSKHAWKLLLAMFLPGSLMFFIGYLSLEKPQFHTSYLCQLSENGAIVTMFYLSAGLGLSALVMLGEVVNLVEAQRHHYKPDNFLRIAVGGVLTLVFAAAIVFVLYRC